MSLWSGLQDCEHRHTCANCKLQMTCKTHGCFKIDPTPFTTRKETHLMNLIDDVITQHVQNDAPSAATEGLCRCCGRARRC